MDLKTYLSEKRGRQSSLCRRITQTCRFAARPGDMSKWATGERPIPAHFGWAIERETGGAVLREEMFPDTWPDYWPELQHRQRKSK